LKSDSLVIVSNSKSPLKIQIEAKLNWAAIDIYPNLKLSWKTYEPINATVQKN
jgi:hypothetical protein